jgi:hypothetical protein
MARNIADMSGTSNSSPQSWMPLKASAKMLAPVATITARSTRDMVRVRQTRTP